MYRLVVCVDVEAASLQEAYGRVYEAMGKVTGPGSSLDWESSDEAFDDNGQIDAEELQKARTAYLDKRTKEFKESF